MFSPGNKLGERAMANLSNALRSMNKLEKLDLRGKYEVKFRKQNK